MSDRTYIYGDSNGEFYTEHESSAEYTHWDPRLDVQFIGGCVQVGIVPASASSTDEQGLWDNGDGQFMTLSRDGCNRLIEAVRACRNKAFGEDL